MVWAVPLSLAATDGITDLFSFPQGTKMVQFPWFACTVLCIQTAIHSLRREGFPIRTSPDQSLLGGSPRLFAAYHVLRRFSMPRHPPFALTLLCTFVSLA
jgi:hypothetical protein